MYYQWKFGEVNSNNLLIVLLKGKASLPEEPIFLKFENELVIKGIFFHKEHRLKL